MKAAIILHFGNDKLLNEMKKYLLKIKHNKFNMKVDIYVSIVKELVKDVNHIKTELKRIDEDCTFFIFPNKGADIGPFLLTIKYLMEKELKYDFIIKLHTKSNNKWRKELIDPLIKRLKLMKILFEQKRAGLVCSNKWLFDIDHLNKDIIKKYCKKWDIKVDWYDELYDNDEYEKIKKEKKIIDDLDVEFFIKNNPSIYNTVRLTSFNGKKKERFINKLVNYHKDLPKNKNMVKTFRSRTIKFVAGTIFAIHYYALIDFIKEKKIDIDEVFDQMKEGYFTDENGTITHAFERILSGVIIDNKGLNIIGV